MKQILKKTLAIVMMAVVMLVQTTPVIVHAEDTTPSPTAIPSPTQPKKNSKQKNEKLERHKKRQLKKLG